MANYACAIADQFIYSIYPIVCRGGGGGGGVREAVPEARYTTTSRDISVPLTVPYAQR